MGSSKSIVRCQSCGYQSPKWMGKCPDCGEFNTMIEELIKENSSSSAFRGVSIGPACSINDIDSIEHDRMLTGFTELNQVLGGGIVPGSLILVGGEPGIGKSTLLLQVAAFIAEEDNKVLIVSGEESARQVKLRATRLNSTSSNLYILNETDMTRVEEEFDKLDYSLMVIDSIQTVYMPEMNSAPGSISQVRECTSHLLQIAKSRNIPVVIIGHVTKDGTIAGPRLLEHMVDTVLYFEGDSKQTYRLIRTSKNRFGSTNEIGLFEMSDKGLKEVKNPSEIFLASRPENSPGSVITVIMEGTRPVLVELQALVTPSYLVNPRRLTSGIDYNRLAITLAVLEKRAGLRFEKQDVFLNVAGGLKVNETSADLAVAVALSSAFKEVEIDSDLVIFGEIGLGGEVRSVSHINSRIKEAKKLGFKKVLTSSSTDLSNLKGTPKDFEIFKIKQISEALQAVL